jgi:hypothetical protein
MDDNDPKNSEEIKYFRETPVETLLGNQIFVLLQVAAVHLAATPPDLLGAQLVIDTLAAMLNAGAERLGEHVELYRNALAEVQQVYVRASHPSEPTNSANVKREGETEPTE